jgi:hypothetical protein
VGGLARINEGKLSHRSGIRIQSSVESHTEGLLLREMGGSMLHPPNQTQLVLDCGCLEKKRIISREASGPLGSVNEP